MEAGEKAVTTGSEVELEKLVDVFALMINKTGLSHSFFSCSNGICLLLIAYCLLLIAYCLLLIACDCFKNGLVLLWRPKEIRMGPK